MHPWRTCHWTCQCSNQSNLHSQPLYKPIIIITIIIRAYITAIGCGLRAVATLNPYYDSTQLCFRAHLSTCCRISSEVWVKPFQSAGNMPYRRWQRWSHVSLELALECRAFACFPSHSSIAVPSRISRGPSRGWALGLGPCIQAATPLVQCRRPTCLLAVFFLHLLPYVSGGEATVFFAG